MGTSSQSCGTSLAIWDHTVLLPPDTSERVPPNPSHAGWYSIYIPRRDGRLSWPSSLDSALAGSRTDDLSITSPTPDRCTTKTTNWEHSKNNTRIKAKKATNSEVHHCTFPSFVMSPTNETGHFSRAAIRDSTERSSPCTSSALLSWYSAPHISRTLNVGSPNSNADTLISAPAG